LQYFSYFGVNLSTKNLETKFLRYLYDRQIEKCGPGMSKRTQSKMYTTHGPGSKIEQQIPGILTDEDNGIKKYLVMDVAIELQSKGLVEFNANNTEFWLTDAGYEMAAKNGREKLLDFLNKNPGLISLVSIIIAIVALIFTVVTYIHPPATPTDKISVPIASSKK